MDLSISGSSGMSMPASSLPAIVYKTNSGNSVLQGCMQLVSNRRSSPAANQYGRSRNVVVENMSNTNKRAVTIMERGEIKGGAISNVSVGSSSSFTQCMPQQRPLLLEQQQPSHAGVGLGMGMNISLSLVPSMNQLSGTPPLIGDMNAGPASSTSTSALGKNMRQALAIVSDESQDLPPSLQGMAIETLGSKGMGLSEQVSHARIQTQGGDQGQPKVPALSEAWAPRGKPTSMTRSKQWSPEVENNFRFQSAGYRDIDEYMEVVALEPEIWAESGFVKMLQNRKTGYFMYFRKGRELADGLVRSVKLFLYC